MSILVAPIRWQTFERTNFILNWNRIDVANFTLNFNSCRIHFYSQHAIGQSGIWSKPSKHHKNSTPNATRKIECARNYCAQRQCNYSFGYENVETISLDRNVLNGEMPSTKLANCLHTHIAYMFGCPSYRHTCRVQCTRNETEAQTLTHILFITTPAWHTFRRCTSFVCRFTRTEYMLYIVVFRFANSIKFVCINAHSNNVWKRATTTYIPFIRVHSFRRKSIRKKIICLCSIAAVNARY